MAQGAVALGVAALVGGGVAALRTEVPGAAGHDTLRADGVPGGDASGVGSGGTAGVAPGGANGSGGFGTTGQGAGGAVEVARDRWAGAGARGGPPSPADGTASVPGVDPRAGGSDAVSPRWLWPLSPRPAVLRPFQAPLSRYGRGHRGLDLAAERGALVLAVEAGRVRHAGPVAGRGTVTVQHGDGLLSTYEPVEPRVRVGDLVVAGDVLGAVHSVAGSAHCGGGTCLHLGARRLRLSYLDPLPLLRGGRLALLPLGGRD